MSENEALILFDGHCNLCNGFVMFIIKRDPKAVFKFASLQSEFADSKLKSVGVQLRDLESVVYIEQGRVFQKSSAALRIMSSLGGLWPLMKVFYLVPKFLRDWVYDLIARHRYRLFGKQSECMVPTADIKARFLS